MTRISVSLLAAILALGLAPRVVDLQEGGKTVADGIYTEAQAVRGAAAYDTHCSGCHRADMGGANGPALREDRFARTFGGQDLKTLYLRIATTMPRLAPASLGDDVYLDIVAHVLRENGFLAGARELNAEGLAGVRILPGRPKPPPPVGDFSYVEVVGCLTPGPGNTWMLTSASEPASVVLSGSLDRLPAGLDRKALGSQAFRLLDAMAYDAGAHKGHKMYVRGLLIRLPAEQRMTISSLEMIAPTCGLGVSSASAQIADGDITIAPPYAAAPELTLKDGVPRGTLHRFTMRSQDSRIYSGIARDQPGVVVPYTRDVIVYVPAQYVPGTSAPFMVVQDGASPRYLNALPPVLDNLIHEKRLPALIAVMVHHGGGDGQGSERGLEYDTLSGTYTEFIETEVLPRVARDYNITFTKDPEGRAAMGGSSGAACALTMAWFHPELYRRVLSYSGTFVNQQSPVNPESPRGAWEYHATIIPASPVKPIRIWMEVGGNDNGSTRDEASYHNWVLANQRMAAVLKARGYHYRYVFAEGARHVDADVVNQTLPDALAYVWAGYPRQ